MNNRLKYICVFIAFLMGFVFVGEAFSFSADVRDISGKRYYPAVKEALDGSTKAVFMVMYIVDLDERNTKSLLYQLGVSFVNAGRRGVEVRVILDQNIDYKRERKEGVWQVEGKNENAFRFFKENGIDVFYDDVTTYTHNKAIVVDNEIVILGSANWSDSAFRRNNETSVLIKSGQLAEAILSDFSNISLDYEASKVKEEKEPPLAIYRCFLEDENLAGKMLSAHDERSFDLYLLLLRELEDDAVIDFDYDKMAGYLGIDKKMEVNAYRRQFNKTLRKLDKRYRLIEFESRWGKRAEVKLLDLRSEEGLYKYPEGRYFLLPGEYFSYGWDKKLSFRAKHCYFINLYKAGLSKDSPRWFGAQETLSLQFHLHRGTISKGMMELRRLNLIDVEYSSIEEGYEEREPTKYKALDLYSPKRQAEKWERLKRLYGRRRVREARKFARVVFEENDTIVIEDIIHLIDEYGGKNFRKAIDIVSQKAVDNPKRTHKYVVGILRGEAKSLP
ncbi:MAG: hypothetical protein KAU12_02240 [Candidatus Omnitrophica bacterium]|nr:hypothetical protein [Candidatus Omnitrophota bacterium]